MYLLLHQHIFIVPHVLCSFIETLVPSAYEPPSVASVVPCSSKCLLLLFFFLYVRKNWIWRVSCLAIPYIWVGCMPAGLYLRCQHGCFVICPWYFPPSLMPQFTPTTPSALQDIYELKDQIQDVEGRYMQGLKELKVEGLELTACLLLSSGSRMVSLTLLPPHSSVPPPVDPNTICCVFVCSQCKLHIDPFFCMVFPHFLFWSNSLVVTWNEDTPTIQLEE